MAGNGNELSEREQEILRLLATGASNKEIASQLYISTNTVKVHLRNIFTKIEVNSRTEAVLFAINSGLVEVATPSVDGKLPVIQSDESPVQTILFPGVSSTVILLLAVLALAAVAITAFSFIRSRETASILQAESAEASSRWTVLPDMPTARFGLGAVASENLIYAIAGQMEEAPSGAIERFDPVNDQWTTLSPKPTPVSDVGAVILSGKLYVPGGKTTSSKVSSDLEIYDLRRDVWENGPAMPVGLSAYAIASFEGRIYLFGGWDGESFQDSVWMFDPDTKSWQEKSPLPSPRGFAGAAVIGGRIFVLGGFNGQKANNENLIYTPDLEGEFSTPWHFGAALPVGRYGMGVAGIGDIIGVLGGIQESGDLPSAWIYLTINDTWQELPKPTEEIPAFSGTVSLGNNLYILGGKLGENPTNQNIAFRAIYTVSFPIIR